MPTMDELVYLPAPRRTTDIPLDSRAYRPTDEEAFQQWYAIAADRLGIDPNPDNPLHYYDYRLAYEQRVPIPQRGKHWPSQTGKQHGHPNEVVGGFNTITGERVPGTKRAGEKELIALGWEPEAAKRLAALPEPKTAKRGK